MQGGINTGNLQENVKIFWKNVEKCGEIGGNCLKIDVGVCTFIGLETVSKACVPDAGSVREAGSWVPGSG